MSLKIRNIAFDKLNTIIDDSIVTNKIIDSIYKFTNSISNKKGIDHNENNILYKRIFVNKLMSLYVNLDPNSYLENKDFLNKVKSNKFDLDNIAFMSPSDIFPERWKKTKDRLNANDEYLYSKSGVYKTDDYKCYRCKERNCMAYDLQTRSVDEPMTTYVQCLNCNNKWSF